MIFYLPGSFITQIITNSSSVVYTTARDVEAVYAVFDEFLKDLGLELTAKEVMTVEMVPKLDHIIDRITDSLFEYEDLPEDEVEPVLLELLNLYEEDYSAFKQAVLRLYVESEFLREYINDLTDSDSTPSNYVVSIEGKHSKIGELLSKLFDAEEFYS